MNPAQYKKSAKNVIRGQRFEPNLNGPLHAIPGSLVSERAQLVRAEDTSGEVNLWQVTLSPVYRKSVGPVIQGQVSRGAPGDGNGRYQVTMRWGGGGVNYQTEFEYPVNGASFSIAGDNVMMEIQTVDFFTVYTEESKPCVNVWVAPAAMPTSTHPLVEMESVGGGGLPGQTTVRPWARQLTFTKADPAATVIIEMALLVNNAFVTVANMLAADQFLQIPVPNRAITVRVTPSAGAVFVMQTLEFT